MTTKANVEMESLGDLSLLITDEINHCRMPTFGILKIKSDLFQFTQYDKCTRCSLKPKILKTKKC